MKISEADARRQNNFDLYTRMIEAQNAKDRAGFEAAIADDIVFEAPAYRVDGEPVAVGRAAMMEMFGGLCRIFESIEYSIVRLIPALDPDLVIAEVAGNNLVAETGKYYRNRYLFLIRCESGKIRHIFEYSNPVVHREAHSVD